MAERASAHDGPASDAAIEIGERVVVDLRGFPKPDDAGDWEYGAVDGFDIGTEELTVRLTGLASRPTVVVPYQNARHLPRAERKP